MAEHAGSGRQAVSGNRRALRILTCLILTQALASQAGLLAPRKACAAESGVDGLQAAPVQPVQHDGLTQQEDETSQHNLFLPFDSQTGLAAFWSGPDFVVVADRPLPALTRAHGGGGIFSSLDVTVLDTGTLIRLHLPAHTHLSLTRQTDGWVLQADSSGQSDSAHSPQPAGMEPVMAPGAVLFPQKQPGQVLSLPDPASGGRLLIATSRASTGGMPQARQAVGYTVRPSLEGVVIAADSGQLSLRTTPDGAVLDAIGLHPVPVGLASEPVKAGTHGQDWEWLGLQDEPAETLRTRMQTQLLAVSRAGAGLSASARVVAAQAAFAAGQPRQALQVLDAAPQQGVKGSTEGAFLHAVAALLAGQPTQAQALDGVHLGDAPETRVWRGLYLMQTGGNSYITSVLLATGFAQLQAYPAPVRALVLPQAATYVARFGDAASVRLLGSLPDDAAYDTARALLLVRNGTAETARVALENLTASSSAQATAYARAALVGLMLEHDMIAPVTAIEAYGNLLDNEGQPAVLPAGPKAAIGLGLAHALTLAGQLKAALVGLDGLHAGPDTPQDVLAAAYQDALRFMIFPASAQKGAAGEHHSDAASLTQSIRLDLVTSHMGRVPDGAGKAKLLVGYGQMLMEAGRPDAAAVAFSQSVAMQADPVARAEAEDFLAQAGLQARRPELAQKALDRATVPAIPGELATQRAYDAARLAAASGDTAKALTLLGQDETDAGLDLRGRLYEAEQRWAEAVLVVGRLATRGLPESGALTEPQRNLALRLATDAAAAQDSATLTLLKGWLAGRTLGRERDALFAMQIQDTKLRSSAH